MISYRLYVGRITKALNNLVVTGISAETIDSEEGFKSWCKLTKKLCESNKTLYFIGNGASAMMASHMAADANKNGGLRGMAFNDPALMTAVSNDISYENSFSLPLCRFAVRGDMLVAISSSGNSPNIIAAITAAKEMGLKIITLSGMSPSNKLRELGELNFYVPAKTYGLIEICHQAILHYWLDIYIEDWKTKIE